MTVATYEEVSPRFRALSKGKHGEGASPEEVQEAERELSVVLPDSYRAFLGEFGWGAFAHWELYGLGADVPSHLHLVRITLEERREFHPLTPPHLVPVLNNGGGDLYCLDTSRLVDGECPVVFWDHDLGEDQIPDEDAPGFLPWLADGLDLVQS